MKKLNILLIIICITFLAAACGSGGGGGGGGSSSNGGGSSVTISGTAAAGAPIVGIVNVKGANGITASSPIEADGSYSVNIGALTSPYILFAQGAIDRRSMNMYSSCAAPGNINITPVTDFILRYALGGTPSAAYNNWSSSTLPVNSINNAETLVQQQLTPVLNAVGVSNNVNLMSDPFKTGQAGMDTALEALDITHNGNTVTVQNKYTGSSYSDNIAAPSGSAGLPASDQANTQAVITEADAINGVFNILEALYATSRPNLAVLNANWAPHIANDFMDDGADKTQTLDDWATDADSGPTVGMSLNAVILNHLTGTPYQKAYSIRIFYSVSGESGNMVTNMVYDGTNWLWYGNQEWTDVDFNFEAHMKIEYTGSRHFDSGFNFWIEDAYNYMYNRGVRSAIITGTGLPAGGLILQHGYPRDHFLIYPGGVNHYWPSNDAVLSAVSTNETYTINFYAETANVVSVGNTPLKTYTRTASYKPVLMSEINASMFPAIITPVSHSISAANIAGSLNVNWTNPSNMQVHHMDLNWSDIYNNYYQAETDVIPGGTSAILDSSSGPAPNNWALLWMSGYDVYGRKFSLSWEFFN